MHVNRRSAGGGRPGAHVTLAGARSNFSEMGEFEPTCPDQGCFAEARSRRLPLIGHADAAAHPASDLGPWRSLSTQLRGCCRVGAEPLDDRQVDRQLPGQRIHDFALPQAGLRPQISGARFFNPAYLNPLRLELLRDRHLSCQQRNRARIRLQINLQLAHCCFPVCHQTDMQTAEHIAAAHPPPRQPDRTAAVGQPTCHRRLPVCILATGLPPDLAILQLDASDGEVHAGVQLMMSSPCRFLMCQASPWVTCWSVL